MKNGLKDIMDCTENPVMLQIRMPLKIKIIKEWLKDIISQ